MDRKKFFDLVRGTAFKGSLEPSQVQGVEALLDACAEHQVTDTAAVAYVLATPMIETGGSYIPVVENLNYSADALRAKFPGRISAADAEKYGRTAAHAANQPEIANRIYGGQWGNTHLGNLQPGDGWTYRGRGLCQITGRANYTKFGLADHPETAAALLVAADVMVVGMRDGLFTGKRLGDYFHGGAANWVEARRIINGLDRADDIARYARAFNAAIVAAS